VPPLFVYNEYMKYKAFTLIELLITIAIIGILTSIASISYTGVRYRARDAQRKNDLNQIKIALSTYYSNQVPASYVASSGATPPAVIVINSTTDALSVALKPGYLKNVPLDPLNTGSNVYKYQSYLTNGVNADYKLFATLENKNDIKGWNGGASWVADGYVAQNE
jgi:prepilin-type N-terminal cleavage/methylation domain-containing protein